VVSTKQSNVCHAYPAHKIDHREGDIRADPVREPTEDRAGQPANLKHSADQNCRLDWKA
jgi:hypothetical protein